MIVYEGTGIDTLTTSLVSGLTDIGNNMLTAMGSILPTVLLVVGGVSVITFGIKLFRKFAK